MAKGPYGGGWRKGGESKKARFRPEDRQAGAGRRLKPAELATVAAEMELAVSPNRYRQESDLDKAKRLAAHQKAVAAKAKLLPLDISTGEPATSAVPKYRWLTHKLPKARRRK
jgi:hypothetical protein